MSASPRKPARLLSRASLMVAAALLGVGVGQVPQAKAANLYWDSDANAAGNSVATGAGLGGAGSWGAADAKWFDGSGDVAWTNANNDTAFFVGAGGQVNLGAAFTVGGLHFGAVGLTTLANETLTFAGATPAVTQSVGARTAVNSTLQLGATTTFDLEGILNLRGGVAGVGGLTKQGSGLLVLRGHNTYQGETSILGGTVLLAGLGNTHDPLGLFGSAGTTVAAGATLAIAPVNAGSSALTLVDNLSLAGRGVGGNGALRLVAGANGANVNGNVDVVSATRVQADMAGTFNLNGIWDLDGTLTAGGTNFVSFGGTSRVLGANPLVHYGISGLRLQGNTSTYSGPLLSLLGEIRADASDPTSGANPYQSVAGLTLRNTTLQLLASFGASAQQNRFSDVAPILSFGSRIRLESNSFNNSTAGQNAVNWNEVLGTLTLVGGQTMMDMRDTASAAVLRSISLAGIIRPNPGTTFQLSGDATAVTELGLGTRYQILNRSLTANVPFVGGWAYSNAEFLKYLAPSGGGFGYTAFVAADYAVDTAVGTWAAGQHVKVTAGNVTLGSGTTTVRSLNFQGSSARTLTGAADSTLIIASGGLLMSGGAHALNVPFLTAGAEGDYHLYDLAWNSHSIASVITDNGANPVSFVKTSGGVTSLFATSTYTGATILNEGVLRDVIGARPAAPALSAANLAFAGSSTQPAIYETDRDFVRALGTGTGQVRFTGGTGSGFGAYGAPLRVNFGGAGETLQWGSPFFNPGIFTLNGGNATHAVTLVNGLDLGGEQRYLRLDGGASASGRGAIGFVAGDIINGSLVRRGGGILWFTDAKSYAGGTQINEGELWLTGAGRAGADVIGSDIQINAGGRLRVESPANIGANQLVILQNVNNDTPAALTLGAGYGTGTGVTFGSFTGTGGDLLGGGLNFLIANNQGSQARRIAITLSGLNDFQADLMGQVRAVAPNVEAWFGADSGNATFTGATLSPSGGGTTAFRLGGHSSTGGTFTIAGANVLRGAFPLIVGAPDANDRNYTDGIIYIPQAQSFAGSLTLGSGGILQVGVDGALGSARSSTVFLRTGEIRLSSAAGLFGATDAQYGFRRLDVASGTGTIRANSLGGGGFVSLALGSLVIGDRDTNNNRVVSFRANGGGSLDFVINGIVSPNLGAAGNFYFDVGDDNTNTVANGMVTINGVIDAGSTGAQVLRKRNGGMLVLNADNQYDGNTLVEQGRLVLGHAGAAGLASTSIDLAANSDRTARLEFRFDGTAPFVLANAGITTSGGNDNSNRIFVAGARTAGNENGVVVLPTLTVGHSGTYAAGGGGNSSLYFDAFNGYRYQLGNIVLNRSIDLRPRSGLLTVNGVISGANALGKNEQGVLWLNGANTYTGGTTVTNGYVVAGNDAAFGNSATSVQFRNNTFSQILASGVRTLSRPFENTATGSTQTLGGLDAGAKLFSGALTLTRGIAVTAAVGGDVTFTGAITGVGGLTKVGAGKVILAPATGNAFTGGIAVTEGELVGRATAAGSAFGANSAFTLSDGVLRLANATGAANTTASTGGLTINSGNAAVVVEGGAQATTFTFASLTRTGDATLTLKGVDTDLGGATNEKVVFTAAPTLVNGLIGPWAVIQGAGASAAANFAGYAAGSVVTATYGATGDLDLAAGATQVFDARGTASLLTADRSVYAFVANQDVAFGGRTLRVGAAPGGTLGLAGIILNDGADLTGAAGSTLQLGTNALSLYVDSAAVSAIGVPLANIRNNASNTFANVLTKFGPGTLSLTASSPLQGDVRVSQGVLSLDVANAFATAGNLNAVVGPAVIIHPGATVDLNGRTQEFANLGGSFVQSPVQNIGGTLLMEGATLTVGRLGTNWTYSGQIVGGAGSTLVKIGAGTLTLDNWEPPRANSLDRAFVDQGTLTIVAGDQSWGGPLGFAPSLPGSTDVFLRGGTFSVRVNGDSTGNQQRIALGYDIVAGGGDSILNTVRHQGGGSNKLVTFGALTLGLQRFLTNNDNNFIPRFDGVTTLTNFARVQTDSQLVLAGLITGPYSLEKRGGSDLAIGGDNRAWDGGLVATDGTILFGSRGTDDTRFEGTTFVPLTSANAGTGDIVVNRGTTIRLNTPANVLTAEGSTVQLYGTLATTVTTVQLGTDAAPSAYGLRSTGVGALALQMNEGNFATAIDQSLVGNGQWGLAAASGTTYVAPTLGAGADGVYRFFGSNSATLNITTAGALSGTASLQVGISQLENGFALGNGVANIRLYGDQSWTGATTVFRNREAGSTQNFLEFHGDLATSAFHVYGRLTARGAARFTDDAGAQVNVVNLYPGSGLRIDYNNDVADTAFTSRLDASNLATAQQENKWGDTTPLFLNGAGLSLVSTNTRVNREEIGAITVAQGASLFLERTGTGGQIILSAPSVTRVGQATFAVRENADELGRIDLQGQKFFLANGLSMLDARGLLPVWMLNPARNGFLTYSAALGVQNAAFTSSFTTGDSAAGATFLAGLTSASVANFIGGTADPTLAGTVNVHALRVQANTNDNEATFAGGQINIHSGGLVTINANAAGRVNFSTTALYFGNGTTPTEGVLYVGGNGLITRAGGVVTAAGLTVHGEGNLQLTNTANAITGTLQLNGGVLYLDGVGTAGTATIALGGDWLANNDGSQMPELRFRTANADATWTSNGVRVLADVPYFRIFGQSTLGDSLTTARTNTIPTLTIDGTSTLQGTTFLFGNTGNGNNANNYNLAVSGATTLGGTAPIAFRVERGGTNVQGGAGFLLLNGAVSGAAPIIKSGDGILRFSGNNTALTSPVTLVRGELRGFGDTNNNVFGTGDYFLNYGTLRTSANDARTYFAAPGQDLVIGGAVTFVSDRNGGSTAANRTFGANAGTNSIRTVNGAQLRFNADTFGDDYYLEGKLVVRDSAVLANDSADLFLRDVLEGTGRLTKGGIWYAYLDHNAASSGWTGRFDIQQGSFRVNQDAATLGAAGASVVVNPSSVLSLRSVANLGGASLEVRTTSAFNLTTLGVSTAAGQTALYDLFDGLTMVGARAGVLALDNGATFTAAPDMAAFRGGDWYLGSNSGGTLTAASLAPWGVGGAQFLLGGGTGTLTLNPAAAGAQLAGAGNSLVVGVANAGYGHLTLLLGANSANTFGGGTLVTRSRNQDGYRGSVLILQSGQAGATTFRTALGTGVVDVFGEVRIEGTNGTVRGAADSNANTWVFHPGSRIRFDNDNPLSTASTQGRWADNVALALNTAVLELYGDGAASAYNTETIGALSVAGGSEVVLRRRGAFLAELITGDLTRVGAGTLMVTGMDTNTNSATGLGEAGTTTVMRMISANGATLMSNGMVAPWITDRAGNQFLKYDATLGFRPFTAGTAPANYVTSAGGALTVAANDGTTILNLGTANATLGANLDLHALRTDRDINVSADGAFNRITLRSGGLLQSGNTPTINADLYFGAAGDGAGEALIWASNNTLQINGRIFASQVNKSGTAFLNVRADQPQFAGGWIVNGGGIQFLTPGAQGAGTVSLMGSRMTDRDNTYGLAEVRYNFNSGSPDLFTWAGGAITSFDYNRVYGVLATDRLQQIPALNLRTTNAVAGTGQPGTLVVQVDGFRSTLRTGAVTLHDHYQVFVESGTFGTGSTTGVQFGAGTGVGGLDNQSLFDFSKIGDGVLTLGDNSATFDGNRSLVVGEGALRVTHAGSLGAAGVNASVEQGGALEVAVVGWSPLATLTLQPGAFERWAVDGARAGNYVLPAGVHLQVMQNQTGRRTVTLSGGSIMGYMPRDWDHVAVIQKLGADVTVNLAADSFLGQPYVTSSNGVWDLSRLYDQGKINQANANNPTDPGLRGSYLQIDGTITGPGGLTKLGQDVILLAGANTYQGLTRVEDGVLQLGRADALPVTTGLVLVTTSGSLDLNGYDQRVASLSGAAGVVTNGAFALNTLTVRQTTDTTFAGTLDGNVTLRKEGTGVLTLAPVDTMGVTTTGNGYRGGSILAGGLVAVSMDAALGDIPNAFDADNLAFAGGGLRATASFMLSALRGLTVQAAGGVLDVPTGVTLTVPGATSGIGALAKTGAGSVRLDGATDLTGLTTVGAGVLEVASGRLAGGLAGSGAFNKVGAGLLQLSGDSAGFTGQTSVAAGELRLASAASLGGLATAGRWSVASGATLSFAEAVAQADVVAGLATGNFTAGSFLGLDVAGERAFTADLAGGQGLTKSGAGLLTLSGAGTFTGGVRLAGGTLAFAPGSLGSGTITFQGNASLRWSGAQTTDLSARLAPVAPGLTAYLDLGANDVAFATGLAGAGTWTKSGSGVLSLNAVSALTGTLQVSAGTVRLGVASALPSAALVRIDANSTLDLDGNALGLTRLAGLGSLTNASATAATLSVGSAQDSSVGTLSGALALTKIGTGNLSVGSATYAGATTLASGRLTLSSGSLNGAIGGAGILTKAGNGVLTLGGAGSYAGGLEVLGGTLRLASADAAGTVGVRFGDATIEAVGGARTFGGAVTFLNNATQALAGSHPFTFTNVVDLGGDVTDVTFRQNVAGQTVTFAGGLRAAQLTLNGAWTVDGAGDTLIQGNLTGAAGNGFNLVKNGNGTLTLELGGASDFTQRGAAVIVRRGTLALGADEVIPHGAGAGGLIFAPEAYSADTATFDLRGRAETVTGLTATSNGTLVIDNTSATPATLTVGADGAAVTLGGGAGAYTMTDSGAGALSFVKTGAGAGVVADGVVLSYQGATSVTGGSLVLRSPLTASTSLSVSGANSVLALEAGHSAPSVVTAVSVGAGSRLSLVDGARNAFTSLTSLGLGGVSGTNTTLELNVGDLSTAGDGLRTDVLGLTAGGTLSLFAGNKVTFNLVDSGLSENQTYTLVTAADGGLTSGVLAAGDWLLGSTPGGFSALTLAATNGAVTLTTGTLVSGDLYWQGAAGLNWSAGLTNWSTDLAGTVTSTVLPGQASAVRFQRDSAAAAPITTNLDRVFRVRSLAFAAGTSAGVTPASVTLAAAGGRLDLSPASASQGISLETGASASVVLAAPLRLAAPQTWTVTDAAGMLTVSGALSGDASVTQAGLGRVTLSGIAAPEFNPAGNATYTVSAGALIQTHPWALGRVEDKNLMRVIVQTGGAYYYSDAATQTIALPLELAGGTLSVNQANQVYGGAVTVSANSIVNLRDANSAVTTTTARQVDLLGVLTGSGRLTLESIDTAGGGNRITGNLRIAGANPAWTGGMRINAGTVIAAQATSLGNGPLEFAFGKLALQGQNGESWTLPNAIVLPDAGVAELNVDNMSAATNNPFTATLTGPVSLGVGSALRIYLSDGIQTPLSMTGNVTLAGPGSISLSGAGTGGTAHLSGVISGAFALGINDDLGAWAQTNRTVRLSGVNTFTGDVTVAGGELEFTTVTAASGAASSLGSGNNLLLGGGSLVFVGTTSQTTNRVITGTAAVGLGAKGQGGASITYTAPIASVTFGFNLFGDLGSVGVIAGGLTSSGATDANLTGGVWTFNGASPVTLGDDFVVTGIGTVLNLDATGILSFNAAASADASLLLRNGAVVNLGADNAVVAADFDRLFLSQDSDGAASVLNMGAFALTTSRLILGERSSNRTGDINGTGLLTVTGGDIDLYRGTIRARLASNGTTSLEKIGPGLTTLAGDNRGLASTGSTIVYEGTLRLDYTADNNDKIRAASGLNMQGGVLELLGNAAAPTTQTVAGLAVATGYNQLTATPGSGQTLTLAFGALTRTAAQGVARLNAPAGASYTTSTANSAHGLLGATAFLTVRDVAGATSFATNDGAGAIVGRAVVTGNDAAAWTVGAHVTDAGAGFTGVAGRSTLGSLRFDAAAGSRLTLANQAALVLNSGGLLVTDRVVAGSAGITGGLLRSASGEIVVVQESARPFEITSAFGFGQTLTKAGNGVLRLSGQGLAPAVNLLTGTLELAGQSTGALTFGTNQDARVRVVANSRVGTLSGGRIGTESNYGVLEILPGVVLSVDQSTSAGFSAVLTGSGTINQVGVTNLNLNATSLDFTGAVTVNAGLFQLSGNGRLGASSVTINRGGAFLFDNNGTTRSGDRIPDGTPIVLNSANGTFGGQTQLRGLALRTDQNAGTNETIGSLVFGSGASYLTGFAGTGANAETSLVATTFERRNFATVVAMGRSLGLTADANGRNNFRIGDATAQTAFMGTQLVGGAGAAATTTISIVPWAFGENLTAEVAVGNMGNSLVTYVSGAGFRPLAFANEYATYALAGATGNVRESLTASLTGLAGKTVNAVVIHNNSTAASGLSVSGTGAGQGLVNTSGAFLFTLNPAAAASSAHTITLDGFGAGITLGASAEYVFGVINPSAATNTPTLAVTVASALNTPAALTKTGRGTLVLSAVNAAGGGAFPTVLNEGVLQIADLDNIGGNAGPLVFGGGTLRLAAGFSDSVILRPIDIREAGATLDLGADVSIPAGLGAGPGGFTKLGTGALTLGATATYQGATTIAGAVTLTAPQALPAGTVLTLGVGTQQGSVNFGAFDATLGGLAVRANSATAAVLTVAPGRVLRINGELSLTNSTNGGITNLNITGGGSLIVNAPEIYLGDIGGVNTVVRTNLDLTGLASAELSTPGRIVIARLGDNVGTGRSVLRLSDGANLVLAEQILIGASSAGAGNGSPQQTLHLGAGTNVLRADSFRLGIGSRDSGLLGFAGAAGSVVIRDRAGLGRTDFILGPETAQGTGAGTNTVVDFSGRQADVAIGTFATSLGAKTAANTNDLLFSVGTLDILNLNMAFAKGTGASMNRLVIGGGTTRLGGSVAFGDAGTGSLVLATAGEGQLNITGGTVEVGAALRRAGAGVASVTLNGGTLDLNGNAVGDATFGVTLNAQSGTLRDVGTINGTGGLTKSTAGTLTLEGNSAYAGVTSVTGGKLIVPSLGDGVSASALGVSALTPANLLLSTGVTLGYAGAGETTGRGFTQGDSLTIEAAGTGALAFTSAAKVAFSTVSATRTLTLTGTQAGANTFGAGLSDVAAADATKFNLIVKDAVGAWVITNGETLKSTARIDVNGGLLGLAGGVLPLAGRVDLATGTTLRLETGNTDDLGSRIQLDAGAAVTLAVASDVSFATSLAVAGAGSASVTKSGAGKLTLAAANTNISGGFTVAQGTLDVTHAQALGAAPANVTGGLLNVNAVIANTVNVANGGTLGGAGTVAAVNVATGGTLSPGNSPGMFTAGNVVLAGGSIYDWQVQNATNHTTGYDKLTVTGNLDLTGASSANRIVLRVTSLLGAGDGNTLGNPLNFSAPGGVASIRTFQFASVQAGSSGVLLNNGLNISDVFAFNVDGFRYSDGSTSNAGLWSIDWNQGSGAITLTAVPEPSTYGFGLGALALAAAAIRRRRKRQAKA
jgi:autotransporter-associated beta strand protein